MSTQKVLSDIVESAVGAKTHFDAWWAQVSEAPRQRGDLIMHRHLDFFSASRDAHYVAFFIYFARLFDKRQDSSSIPTYLRRKYPNKDVRESSEDAVAFALLAERASALIGVRHKAVAHIDATLTEEDVFAPVNLTWNQIRALLQETIDLVVRLDGARHQGELGIPHNDRMRNALFELLASVKV